MLVVEYQICVVVNKDIVLVDKYSMVCVGYVIVGNVISGCQGDSGGLFVCKENGYFVFYGVVSWGYFWCEVEIIYIVFICISFYVDWINYKIVMGGLVNFLF